MIILENIYCDMDGVLADFNAEINGKERFRDEKKFFLNLKPIAENVETLKILNDFNEVYILSASPNKRCDRDKIKWLKKHCPFIKKKNIIIIRNGQKKVDFMKTREGILFDDYGLNCREWLEKKSNRSFKISAYNPISKYCH